MFQSEAEFSQQIVTWLTKRKCQVQTIESAGTSIGIADMYFSSIYMKGWAELKNEKAPIGLIYRVPFRPRQFPWLRDMSRHGTFCVLLIAHQEGVSVFSGEGIKKEYTRADLIKASVTATEVSCVNAIQGEYDNESKKRSVFCDPAVDIDREISINAVSGYISDVPIGCGRSGHPPSDSLSKD